MERSHIYSTFGHARLNSLVHAPIGVKRPGRYYIYGSFYRLRRFRGYCYAVPAFKTWQKDTWIGALFIGEKKSEKRQKRISAASFFEGGV